MLQLTNGACLTSPVQVSLPPSEVRVTRPYFQRGRWPPSGRGRMECTGFITDDAVVDEKLRTEADFARKLLEDVELLRPLAGLASPNMQSSRLPLSWVNCQSRRASSTFSACSIPHPGDVRLSGSPASLDAAISVFRSGVGEPRRTRRVDCMDLLPRPLESSRWKGQESSVLPPLWTAFTAALETGLLRCLHS